MRTQLTRQARGSSNVCKPREKGGPDPLPDGVVSHLGQRHFWADSTASALAVTPDEHSPIRWNTIDFRKSLTASAYIKPTKLLPLNNVDEQPRAEFLPLLDARDRFGQVVGYPGAVMQYFAPSTVHRRYAGSECFFLFDRPLDAMGAAGWEQMLEQIAARFRAHLQIKQVTTDYASYRLGDRVLILARVSNWRPAAAATEIHFFIRAPGEKELAGSRPFGGTGVTGETRAGGPPGHRGGAAEWGN